MSDRDSDIDCTVAHADEQPELSEVDQLRTDNESLRYQIERARWALGTDEPVNEQLRQAEIRAAVAEREAVAYRNQVKALVRAIQRERGVPEDALDGEVFVVAADDASPSETQRLARAVDEALKLHRHELQDDRHEDTAVCAADGEEWPCPTVTALTKAVGGEQS